MDHHTRPKTAPTGRILSRRGSGRLPLPTLPDYVFTDRLGSGTYATVYKAFKKVKHLYNDTIITNDQTINL